MVEKKKRNPQDLTLRNLRALKTSLDRLHKKFGDLRTAYLKFALEVSKAVNTKK